MQCAMFYTTGTHTHTPSISTSTYKYMLNHTTMNKQIYKKSAMFKFIL